MYDYCIIGAGPTGLTLAFLFSKIGKKCLIVDENKDIGGCHRVTRINGLFTEHGPRIYSNSYINTKELLKKMDINFEKLFKPYNFTISNIGKLYNQKFYNK
jgi:UDP-galactopyranose mutase